ncbi:MAG TPA: 23S rRNA (guanosine(2251)-2'-O)-methyltransferase RlmB [Steroidobacteraceae bacterium]|nr:23S rRNA (guanosine(2251)-2'-O)-methyltransferase RlmB [Steroidobacteraceae bacterium]
MSDPSRVYGVHAVRWLLKQHPERVRRLWLQSTRDDARTAEVAALAREAGISVQRVDARKLDEWTGAASHQGVMAEAEPSRGWAEEDLYRHLEALAVPALLLLLDGVQDPHNLGACLRTADACGAHALIVPRDRAAGLTPVARKVAAGAAETVPVVTVTNLARTMRALKERNLWLIGADAQAERDASEADLKGAVGLVMGSEGEGMRRLTRESCDVIVRLPLLGAVESLNVSVAAGMLLYEAVRQRRTPGTAHGKLV